jgi:hypothetical protein
MSSFCDLPDFFNWSEPVAAKQHPCCECWTPIPKGEKHFCGTGMWEGELATYRQHLACMEACMLIRDEFYGGECIGFGALKEEFSEMVSDRRYPERDRYKEPWQRLRHLMAVIRWREHAAGFTGLRRLQERRQRDQRLREEAAKPQRGE